MEQVHVQEALLDELRAERAQLEDERKQQERANDDELYKLEGQLRELNWQTKKSK